MDISKCSGVGCALKDTCYRYTCAGGAWQSYIRPAYKKETKKCEFYYKDTFHKGGHKDYDRVFRKNN